jgi:alpha-tubulin suppressor-like RCC1 family protein
VNLASVPASQISAGGAHTCALLGPSGNNLRCWGHGNAGELGNGPFQTSATPVTVNGSDFQSVAAGFDFVCGLTTNEAVFCWGNGTLGQMGNFQTSDQGQPTQTISSNNATQVVAGGQFACALLTAGTVDCWGSNQAGQIGDGMMEMTRTSPTPVAQLTSVAEIWAGDSTACARLADNSLWCWGASDDGQLGSYTSQPTPVMVQGPGAPFELAIGLAQICMLRAGAVSCWGGDTRGELGDGVANPLVPRTVALSCPMP